MRHRSVIHGTCAVIAFHVISFRHAMELHGVQGVPSSNLGAPTNQNER